MYRYCTLHNAHTLIYNANTYFFYRSQFYETVWWQNNNNTFAGLFVIYAACRTVRKDVAVTHILVQYEGKYICIIHIQNLVFFTS